MAHRQETSGSPVKAYDIEAIRRIARRLDEAADTLDGTDGTMPAAVYAGPYQAHLTDLNNAVTANVVDLIGRLRWAADRARRCAVLYERSGQENVGALIGVLELLDQVGTAAGHNEGSALSVFSSLSPAAGFLAGQGPSCPVWQLVQPIEQFRINNTKIQAGMLAVSPALVYWAVSYYFRHPDRRADFGTQAAVDRMRRADYPDIVREIERNGDVR